jgi:adenylosuccinate lyase
MLQKFTWVLANLKVKQERMKNNLEITRGLIFSQRVMIELTKKGVPREKAYQLVQDIALKSWENENDFKEMILKDQEINKYLTREQIISCFDYNYFIRNIDYIYQRLYEK